MEELTIHEITSTNYEESCPTDIETNVGFSHLDKYEFIKSEINDFTELKNNWDGYGAIPLFSEIGTIAKTLLPMLSGDIIDRVFDIFPNPHGTITIEWENRENEKLSLEIGKNNYSYFIKYNHSDPELVNGKDILTDFRLLTSHLEDLFSEEIQTYILP